MKHYAVAGVALALIPSFSLPQGNPPATPAPVSYSGEAVVVEQAESVVRYNADGTGETEIHQRVRIQSEAGARQLSVLSIPYASATDAIEVRKIVVHHPGGSDTETPAADAMEMPAPVTQQAPLYSDLKFLQIPVRSLAAGDILEYRVGVHRKSTESPGQFWENYQFPKTGVVLKETLTLDVPADKFVQTWSPNLQPAISESAGRKVYAWTMSQLKPTSSEQKNEGEPETPASTKVDVGWSTFHTWEEVGAWYRGLATQRAAATDALRAKADELTHDAKSPEEQVQAIYSFVSTRIRYIGIDFGIGRYQPHAAAEVMTNQYGDCKDKDTLLEALLRAKGFSPAPALIGVNVDMVTDLPSPAFFNHVITTVDLPSGRVWMDSTPEVAPFRLLLAPLRDKQSLVIPVAGPARLDRTPIEEPFPFSDRLEATATLSAEGELKGHVTLDFHSDNEITMRAIGRVLAPAQWDKGTQYIANLLGFSGTTSNSSFARSDDTSVPFRISYDYTKKPFGDWDNFRIIPLFPINIIPAAPDKEPKEPIDLGPPRTESALSRIKLPDGFHADLPEAVHVRTAFAIFEKTYKFENGELVGEKKLVVLQSKLPSASWEQYKKFIKDASLGEESWVQLTSTTATGKGPHPPRPGENNPAAAQLVSEANVLERSGDWEGTLKKLDEAKKLQPEQPYLWSNYGWVAVRQNKTAEAEEDFRHELEEHPDEVFVVRLYVGFLMGHRRPDDAQKVLKNFFDRDPSDSSVAISLAGLEAVKNLPEAIATLRKAKEAAPSDRSVQSALGEYLVQDHRETEAAELAKKIIDAAGDNDSNSLNSGAYLLAEANGDLTLAEQKSRKSLEILDNQTGAASIGEANAQSFQRTSLVVASWDTLGYVLLKEKKLDEARDYTEAAWRNRPDIVVGVHFAEVLEALGERAKALRIYKMSSLFLPPLSQATVPEKQQSEAGMKRLEAAHVDPDSDPRPESGLQEQRTFELKLKTPGDSYASATYRLQLAAGEVQEVIHVSGEGFPVEVQESIRKLKLPHLVPTHSKARILRDGVLTCSPKQTDCTFVLMPLGSINAEQIGN